MIEARSAAINRPVDEGLDVVDGIWGFLLSVRPVSYSGRDRKHACRLPAGLPAGFVGVAASTKAREFG